MPPILNLRNFLDILQKNDQLLIIDSEMDPYLEIAEIHRRVIARRGPALLFTNVKGSSFPVTTNLFGTGERLELAFGRRPLDFVRDLVNLVEHLMPPKMSTLWQARPLLGQGLRVGLKSTKNAPVMECCMQPARLSELPMLTSWHSDGGPFVTLPLVYTEHPDGLGHNLGMYRIQRYDDTTTGIHWQIHKGGGYHYYAAEQKNQALPMTLYIGGPPALMLAAIAPQTVDENQLLTFKVSGADPDKEDKGKLTLSALHLPQGAIFDAQSGQFSWKPTFEQAGSYAVTFVVRDRAGLSDPARVAITVNQVNRTPVFPEQKEQIVDENSLLTYKLIPATDPDKEDKGKLKYSALNLPQGATFDAQTLTLKWKPTFDQSGVYTVDFQVTDGEFTVKQPLKITVKNVN
ncbi:MAG: UbiD family decarboxylase, partial [Desulfobulbaceae bacterium]|nr:UbiD family decarboxylase [Desulfobulbaceae bacterium]